MTIWNNFTGSQWVLNGIFKTNTKPANLGYFLFIGYQRAISFMPVYDEQETKGISR